MSAVWLLLETSGRGGQVGVKTATHLHQAALDPARRHNRDLASTAAQLLQQAGQTSRDLTGVMVSVGPGSFTGLRVGVMSAKMLAYALGCSLVAVPTFAIIAQQSPPECQSVEVLSDGLQGLIHRQRFARAAEQWKPVQELAIVAAKDWATSLPADVWISGPAVPLVEGLLKAEQPRIALESRTPGLAALFEVGQHLPALSLEEVMKLEPLYLRPSSAEEQAARRQAATC